MAHEPTPKLSLPQSDTDQFRPVPRRLAPRLPWLALLFVGLAAGGLAGYHTRPGAALTPYPVEGLLGLALPPQRDDGLVFSVTPTRPTATADLLPAGVAAVYAFYSADIRERRLPPVISWTRDGKPLAPPAASGTATSANHSAHVVLRAPGGKLAPGVYEVQLQWETVSLAASFVAAWGAEGILGVPAPAEAEALISGLAVASSVTESHQPRQPRQPRASFPGSQRLHAAFRFSRAEPGTTVMVKWYGGREPILSATSEIILPSTAGTASAWMQAPQSSPLPAGQYRVAVTMSADDRELASAAFTVTEPLSRATPPSP